MNKPALNADQEAAAEFFFDMLFNDNVKEMAITGGAGKGKTFLISYLNDVVMERYYEMCSLLGVKPKYHEFHLTATTNKAAEVLSKTINKPARTTHSFFNLSVFNCYETGETRIKKSKAWTVHQNAIIVIDEGYQVDSPLRRLILEGTQNCKIVYVGDAEQMNPIKEKISPVADPRNGIPSFELTIPMRNAGKPQLVQLCDDLRNAVKTLNFPTIQTFPDTIVYLSDEEAEQQICKTFANPVTDSRILCYRNARVNEINNFVRHIRGLPTEYQEGEFLICNSAHIPKNRDKSFQLSVEDEVLIDKLWPTQVLFINDDPNYPINVKAASLKNGYISGEFYIPDDQTYIDQLSKYFKRNKMWPYFFWLQENLVDLRPRDASTVYKAQGSTLKSVFIDLTDISHHGVADKFARLWHVAASRAQETIYLFGELPEKFGRIL